MIYTSLTKQALRLCFDAHREQTDKTGLPYVFHPFHLAEEMTDELSTVCALLHDVVEDTHITLADLTAMGYPGEVTEVLALLTHDPTVPYMDYVRAIAEHPVAARVKMADLRHNSDLTRLDVVDEWALARQRKYEEALAFLKERTESADLRQ